LLTRTSRTAVCFLGLNTGPLNQSRGTSEISLWGRVLAVTGACMLISAS
jgi:hypothetical protein